MRIFPALFVLPLALLLATACSPTVATSGGDGGTYQGPTKQFLCQHYLDCIAAAAPTQLPTALATYGGSGTCWKLSLTEQATCAQACSVGLEGLRKGGATAPACAECRDDKDCAKPNPSCASETHTCTACSTDAQCTDPQFPSCEVGSHKCVACGADSDCKTVALPGCNMKSRTCVACSKDAHCTGATPACDTDVSKCVGCLVDAHCANAEFHYCDQSEQKCVECLEATQCTNPDLPGCSKKTLSCVACTATKHCQTPLVCDTSAETCVECNGTGDCGPNKVCNEHACCETKCDGKSCGDNSCGGVCGICAADGSCTKSGHCSPCESDKDCGKTQFCYTGKGPAYAKSCASECNVFTNFGCQSGESCTVGVDFDEHTFANCQPAGSLAYFASCKKTGDCIAGSECYQPGTCRPYCDATHPCPAGSGTSCVELKFTNNPKKYAICQ